MTAVTYYNGKIFTANKNQPFVESITVDNGVIQAINASPKESTEAVNLNGQCVIPGIIDAHLHPLFLANAALGVKCSAPDVTSIEDLINEVRTVAEKTTDGWLTGWGYEEGKLAEGRTPTRWDLDKACTELPVALRRACGHIMIVNSRALEIANVTKDTPNPPGGIIERDENGEATGVIIETARDFFIEKMPTPSIAEEAEKLVQLGDLLFSKGITTVSEMLALNEPMNYFDLYKEAEKRGYRHRTGLYVEWQQMLDATTDSLQTDSSEQIYIAGLKIFMDGSVSGQSAAVSESYFNTSNKGVIVQTNEELVQALQKAQELHIQLSVHAMGDIALDMVLEEAAKLTPWLENGPSVRLEHATFMSKEQMQRAKELNIAVVTQPIFMFAEIESYILNLGQAPTEETYLFDDMLASGMTTVFSSDAPATAWADPVDPFISIQSAVTRTAYEGTSTGKQHAVSVEESLYCYTKYAQIPTLIKGIGSLEIGHAADFVVLSDDIFAVAPEKLGELSVQQTYYKGELVFEKETAIAQ
ncbi:amidohydrolase [Solibacillus sp. FSL H8-0538]|uniref:amidohydrolase n=1 Tax=Solibacillus sp. FSL H8-0538 TaxID=2921400 RepID=UPI0030FD1EC6